MTRPWVEYRLTEQPAMTCHYLGRNLPSQWVRLSGNDFDPAEIAAAVPVLLGYHPDGDTVVMVCLNRHGSALRLGPLAGIPLAGIPLPAPSGEIVAGYLPPLRALIGTSSADAVLLIAYTAAPGAYAELALTLADALQGTATDVLDVLLPSNARKGARHMAAMDTSGRIGIDREDDEQSGIEAFGRAGRDLPTDGNALDAVAALLGGTPSWPGADMLEWIAEIVTRVRPDWESGHEMPYLATLAAHHNGRVGDPQNR